MFSLTKSSQDKSRERANVILPGQMSSRIPESTAPNSIIGRPSDEEKAVYTAAAHNSAYPPAPTFFPRI